MNRSIGLRRLPVLLLALGCASPEMPGGPAPQAEARLEHRAPPPAPPIPPRQWSVRIRTSGGFAGHGRGISVDSDSGVAEAPRCGALSGESRMAVENAVAAARPERWQRRYENDRFVTDEMRFSLMLTVEGRQYDTAWRSATKEMLPSDLEALDAALWSARQAHLARCR